MIFDVKMGENFRIFGYLKLHPKRKIGFDPIPKV
jgi:hypothetical protein